MLKKFDISGFKGFKDASTTDFKKINIIAGKNNSGKSSYLEALFLSLGVIHPQIFKQLFYFRNIHENSFFWGIDSLFSIESLKSTEISFRANFDDFSINTMITRKRDLIDNNSFVFSPDFSKTYAIKCIKEGLGNLSSKLSYDLTIKSIAPFIDIIFQNHEDIIFKTPFVYYNNNFSFVNDINLVGKFEELRMKNPAIILKIKEALQLLDPKIEDCSPFSTAGGTFIFLNEGKGFRPIHEFGQGLSRWLQIILSMAFSSQGICLIDEIENGFHFSFTKEACKHLLEFSKIFNTQVFATTHSLEFIQHIVESEDYSEEDFSYYRTQKIKDNIILNSFDKYFLKTAIKNDWEIR